MTNNRRIDVLALLVLGCITTTGRGEEIETEYGRRTGIGARRSVNGTAVLAKMFEKAGHKVSTSDTLSPRFWERVDCIVWLPDDFRPPDRDTRQRLEDWLYDQPGRTLIYVGRDFDALRLYWKKVQGDAPPGQRPLIDQEWSTAEANFRVARRRIPNREDCDWFVVEGRYRHRRVRTLQGNPRWLQDVDESEVEIELNGRIRHPFTGEVLLRSEEDVLVSRDTWRGSQIIVVTNGSFLLNLPLVNHEHRKLAGKLIDEIGPPDKTVVFLQSGSEGPQASRRDDEAAMPMRQDLLLVPPTCWIFLHLAVVGILFCFSRWPIFGTPRELPPGGTSDFGKHVAALGQLLARSRDKSFATTRLLHYRQTTKGGEGD